jgi:hypothetical protein
MSYYQHRWNGGLDSPAYKAQQAGFALRAQSMFQRVSSAASPQIKRCWKTARLLAILGREFPIRRSGPPDMLCQLRGLPLQSEFCLTSMKVELVPKTRNSNLLFLPDLHSLDLLKGQLVPRSIINPGGRGTRMSSDPLRDFDFAVRIHVLGNARRTEAVTTNSFQDPACPRPFDWLLPFSHG